MCAIVVEFGEPARWVQNHGGVVFLSNLLGKVASGGEKPLPCAKNFSVRSPTALVVCRGDVGEIIATKLFIS